MINCVIFFFSAAHSPGLVPIRAHSNRKQVSTNSMVFEYKADLKPSLVKVPSSSSETSLKLCLISRIESLEKCFRNFKVRGPSISCNLFLDIKAKSPFGINSQNRTGSLSPLFVIFSFAFSPVLSLCLPFLLSASTVIAPTVTG